MNYLLTALTVIMGAISSCIAAPTISSMAELGKQAAQGDWAAVDKIAAINEELYQGIDYTQDRQRVLSNLTLMRAALDEIAFSIHTNQPDDIAFRALLYANKKKNLADLCADSFGLAAANGNNPSLDVLLQHAKYDILLSSAVIALQKPAKNGNKKAIRFLVDIVNDNSKKPLWHVASEGITEAAQKGDDGAQRALQKYAEYKNTKR